MSIAQATSFESLLNSATNDPADDSELRKLTKRAVAAVTAVGIVIGVWCFAAPLSGAVIAPAQLKVELNRKTVQHQEGGIVREILVRDGQRVRAGDPLVVVGSVRNDAELSLLKDQLLAEQIRAGRAAAEAAVQPHFDLPAQLAPASRESEHFVRESALFLARQRTLNEQLLSLQEQINEARSQSSGLQLQIDSAEAAADLAREELAINEKLVSGGYVQKARVLQLQRTEADYRSRVGESRSEIALARQRMGELQARMAQTRNQYQQLATDELREASARIREIEERLRPSQDQVERQMVRAPVDGEIMTLRVAAIGDVIGPREPILDILPSNEKLVVEARVRPQDINHVLTDSAAEVRITAFDSQTTPPLPARVSFVSPDRVSHPETGESWFVATVEVDAAPLQDHPDLRLRAGMPAEVFVTTPERTLFAYLAKPFMTFTNRAMREP
jgi:HlyD family type I secretion membrane fusion protein